jgi:hypothetical protein
MCPAMLACASAAMTPGRPNANLDSRSALGRKGHSPSRPRPQPPQPRDPPLGDHEPPLNGTRLDRRAIPDHDAYVAFVGLLIFLGVSAVLLWAAHARAGLGGTNAGRVSAAFVGIWFATLFGTFVLALMGVAENSSGNEGGSVAAIAIGEVFWILVTCGPRREAQMPLIAATLSIAALIWVAVG